MRFLSLRIPRTYFLMKKLWISEILTVAFWSRTWTEASPSRADPVPLDLHQGTFPGRELQFNKPSWTRVSENYRGRIFSAHDTKNRINLQSRKMQIVGHSHPRLKPTSRFFSFPLPPEFVASNTGHCGHCFGRKGKFGLGAWFLFRLYWYMLFEAN